MWSNKEKIVSSCLVKTTIKIGFQYDPATGYHVAQRMQIAWNFSLFPPVFVSSLLLFAFFPLKLDHGLITNNFFSTSSRKLLHNTSLHLQTYKLNIYIFCRSSVKKDPYIIRAETN